MIRVATCSCGQLRLACEGEPVRVSVCHCLECQRRTGSAFGVQARYPRERVRLLEGRSGRFERRGDTGSLASFRFCQDCGSTVYWELEAVPGHVAVAVGNFAEPGYPAPAHSVYEVRRHAWVGLPEGIEHID
ncbi:MULTISPECIES: GFA family protein [unclassified Lysobacter]|uniref:GFA family protein n=1 Tax=unclassified Lysobacter TaxID=2635362 RepID=UPI0006FC5934|nr:MULTISPECIES: GFA family protein [unclassified Lysobacter]KQZ56861.1 aldehyde-activating protein [Lysobacter sp. Root559]KRA81794.1 aldehyde-activating protein [Lysobacter sp. Root667]KRC34705.1 aldehyde-activating protein [Lysobacter sp. Root76]KRD70393.1 aldehyde-activating protein [Lysobacter sp. Root96]